MVNVEPGVLQMLDRVDTSKRPTGFSNMGGLIPLPCQRRSAVLPAPNSTRSRSNANWSEDSRDTEEVWAENVPRMTLVMRRCCRARSVWRTHRLGISKLA